MMVSSDEELGYPIPSDDDGADDDDFSAHGEQDTKLN